MPSRDFQIVFTADTTQAVAGMHAIGLEMKMLEASMTGNIPAMQQYAQQLQDIANNAVTASAHMGNAGKASRGMLTDILAMGAGMLVIQGGTQALADFGAMANKTRDHIKEMAIDTMDLRDKMRELANLKGAKGPDNEVMGEAVKIGMQAGMMPEEIRKYLEQYEGSSPAGEEKGHIDAETKKQLAVEGAKFGVRVKLAPQTAGDLAGVISQYTDLTKDKDGKAIPQDQRIDKAMEQMGRVSYGLNKGRGNLEPLVRSLINTAGEVVSMGGPIEDLGDLAAIQGVASTHASPREAGFRVRQAVRALRDTKGEAGAFLKRTVGIDDGDSHVERLGKLKTQVDLAKKSGKQADIFLRQMGFDPDEGKAVLEQVNDLDNIKIRVAEGKKLNAGRTVINADDDFLRSDRAGKRRMSQAAKAGQEFLIGEGNERFEMAKENAEQRQRDQHAIGGQWNYARELLGDWGGIRTKMMGGESTRERGKAQWAEESLVREAAKVGIDEDTARYQFMGKRLTTNRRGEVTGEHEQTEAERVAGFNKLATEVERRGGNPYGQGANLVPKLDELIRETRETNKILARVGPPAPPRGAGQPGGGLPQARGAAAPKRGI